MNFYRGLKHYRKLKGITQKQLADKLNTNNTNVSNWENGIAKPDMDTLAQISIYFGISVDELMFFEKKSEKIPDEFASPKYQPNLQALNGELQAQIASPPQYDPNDGQAQEFAEGGWSDAQQIEVLNRHISAQNKVIATKNDLIRTKDELLASKDELLASKDQTITAQTASLKLLEGQINATTALIEQLTLFLGNDAKKRPERADVRDASDVGAR